MRVVIVAGGVVGGVALAVLGRVDERWQLYLVYAVFAVGFAGAGLVPATTVVTRWYHQRRSVALSVASTGLSAGGILITPFAKWLIDREGLEAATPILGDRVGGGDRAGGPVAGPAGSGRARVDARRRPRQPHRAGVAATGVRFDDAVRTRFYVGVTIGYLLVLGSQVGAIQQLIKLVEERTNADTAAVATMALAGMSVVARLAGGRIVPRLPMAGFTSGLAAIQAVAMVRSRSPTGPLDCSWRSCCSARPSGTS